MPRLPAASAGRGHCFSVQDRCACLTTEEKFKARNSKFKPGNQIQKRKGHDSDASWFIGLNFGVCLNFGF
jgi:hypothetical protein